MKKYVNLLDGAILPALSSLALPIMATSLIQMAYNLTDMLWIGRIGANGICRCCRYVHVAFQWPSHLSQDGCSGQSCTFFRRTRSKQGSMLCPKCHTDGHCFRIGIWFCHGRFFTANDWLF